MLKEKLIITHGGVAHADELVACALYITHARRACFKITGIERVMSVPDAILEKVGNVVIDIGGVYDGVELFDHHQNEEAVNGKCAAELVCQRFFPELLVDEEFGHFIKLLSFMDNNGPINTAREYGVAIPVFNSLLLLVRGLVKEFEKRPLEIAEMVAAIIEEKLSFLKEVEEAEEFFQDINNASVSTMDNGYVVLNVINPWEGSMLAGNRGQQAIIDRHKVDLVYNIDPRVAGGRCLFRTAYGERKGIVLSADLVEKSTFCHKAGFLLNFIPAYDGEWVAAVERIQK